MIFHFPHYFTSHLRLQVKELYVATAIMDLAAATMLIFEPIYLYEKLGLGVDKILWFFVLVYIVYLFLIPFGAKFAAKFGFKPSLIVSIPIQLAYWACLFFAKDVPHLVLVAAFFYGLAKSFYWPAFGAILAKYSHTGQMGREFGALMALVQLTQIFGPLIGGIIAQVAGGEYLLIVAGVVYALSAIPLFMHKEKTEILNYRFTDTIKFFYTQSRQALAYLGFGEELVFLVAWPVFIYLTVQAYGSSGLLVTVASLLSAILCLYLGKITDGKSKFSVLKFGSILSFIFWIVRPFLPTAPGVLATDTAGRTAKNLFYIPVNTITYQRAQEKGVLSYIVFFEQSLSIGKILTAILCAIIFSATASFTPIFFLAAILSLLYMLL